MCGYASVRRAKEHLSCAWQERLSDFRIQRKRLTEPCRVRPAQQRSEFGDEIAHLGEITCSSRSTALAYFVTLGDNETRLIEGDR